MNIKKNDTVIVLSGKDKGVKGKVLVAMPSENLETHLRRVHTLWPPEGNGRNIQRRA